MKKFSRALLIFSASFLLTGCSFVNPSKNPSEQESTSVSSVALSKNSISLEINSTYSLKATVLPETASNKNVKWSTSDSSVAAVSADGIITAKKVGNATIAVTTVDGNKTDTCAVKVVGIGEKENEEVTDIDVPEDTTEGDFKITCADTTTITKSGNIYTLVPTEAKTVYTISGKLSEGQIIVKSAVKCELDLNGVSLTSALNSPIYIDNEDTVEIKSKADTVNYINDKRATYSTDVEGQGKGGIYSENGDLKFTGTGTISIQANYYNGIHGKDDFSLKNTKIKIKAPNHGIKANDGITVESGALEIDCGADGLKTENTDISSKGNQRGNIDISGGSIIINSVADGISAAHNAVISGTAALEIKTDKFSSYDGESVEKDDSTYNTNYLRVPTTYYNSTDRYAAYISNQWVDLTFKAKENFSRSSYYVYTFKRPSDATSIKLYKFSASQTTNSETNYTAASDAKAFSSYGDMITISSISGTKISLSSWSNYSSSSGGGQGGPGGGGPGGQEGNTDKSDHSAKGIKAENEIHIDGGSIAITAYDDGLHTNCDSITFENGNTPTGNLYITGGDITISSSDDGVHAECGLYISGGNILVSESYEGLEGNTIDISGGNIKVFASDDGVNAGDGKVTASITVSGGLLDETVSPSGDTDGIDSNGTYTQTGGTVIARGPNSSMAAALDTDGAVKLTRGTLVLLGSIEKTPSLTNMTTTTGLSGHSSGNHTITVGDETITYNNKYTYAKTTVYSSKGKASI